MYSICYSCPILMNLAFSLHIFEKYADIKFFENPSRGAELFHTDRRMEKIDGQTDRNDEANSRFRNCTNTHTSERYENNMGDGITQLTP
jgi:hypothetical protein